MIPEGSLFRSCSGYMRVCRSCFVLNPLPAYQKAVREQKLAVELRGAKRERDFYLARVDQVLLCLRRFFRFLLNTFG